MVGEEESEKGEKIVIYGEQYHFDGNFRKGDFFTRFSGHDDK